MGSKQKASQQSSLRKCDICGCNISGGPKAWQIHTEGIRHRRNAASCKVFGEPGHHVISTFEHHDRPPPARYRGKDAVLLSAAAAAGSNTPHSAAAGAATDTTVCAADSASHNQQLQQLQVEVRKHLASQVGIRNIYHRAVERFTMDALAAAWTFVQEKIKQQMQNVTNHSLQPLQEAQQQQQRQHPQRGMSSRMLQQRVATNQPAPEPPSVNTGKLQLSLQEPHQIACLGVVLPDTVHSLDLSVPFQTYGPAAAATSAAVATFLSSLSYRHHVQQLSLRFKCDDFSSILRQGGGGMARLPDLWGKVADVLTAAMKVNCGLEKLTIASYPGQFPPDELAALQVTLATARQQLRTAVLLSTHSRVGSSSLLHQLPHEVMRMLVEMAVPKACFLWLELPPGLDGDDSSSSSSSDDGSSSDWSDSDLETSSSEESDNE